MTVDKIIRGFAATVAKLERHAESEHAKSVDYNSKAVTARLESERAEAIASTLNALIS